MRKAERKLVAPPFSNVEVRENRESADMVKYPDGDWTSVQEGPPGSFCYRAMIAPDGARYMSMFSKLPDGSVGSCVLHPIPSTAIPLHTHEDGKIHAWHLKGDPDRPTLVPSVWLKGHWHGHIKAGRMISL
jgi:hypothetical protein